MRLPNHLGGRTLILFCLLSGLTLTGALEAERRQEPAPSTTELPRQTAANNGQETTLVASTTGLGDASSASSQSLSLTSLAPTEIPASNITMFDDAVLPPDELPIQPEVTPGWAVAGALMLGTGVVHALIGIKTKWLHTFFSTAFLASLGTATLIIYVMTPPVGNAIQGAYVVAAVCTGAVLGGLAIIFKEVTECLGGMLGGFCLSMWLLTLQRGGLVTSPGGIVGFIAAFTFSGFGIYFLPWVQVRTYGLIGCLSFSGATVAVLGIDCFSRAGLKEFWAYIWGLNDDLFPRGALTYPLTRGIKVELAVTIIIFLAGVVSQLKLWRLIKDRRSKREQEIAQGERCLRAEEEAIGRQIEHDTTRERREWERVYGENAPSPENLTDSSAGDVDSEKRALASSATLVISTARTPSPVELDGIQRVELSLDPLLHSSPHLEKDVIETVITKHIDDTDLSSPVKEDNADRPRKRESVANGMDDSTPLVRFPVYSLPFQPPDSKTEEDGRSSFATFADFEDRELTSTPRFRDSRAENMARRLSSGSTRLLRSLSQRSTISRKAVIEGGSESQEDLVESRRTTEDDADSVVAVLDITDRLSCDDHDDDETDTIGASKRQSAVTQIEVPKLETEEESDKLSEQKPSILKVSSLESAAEMTSLPGSAEAQDHKVKPLGPEEAIEEKYISLPGIHPPESSEAQDHEVEPLGPEEAIEEKSIRRASPESVSATLRKGNLPPALSRVALSYRTNEWAKHLSAAETPCFEDLQSLEGSESIPNTVAEEPAVPLDIIDLQQTAENARVPPAVTRPISALSNYSGHPPLNRSDSRNSLTGYPEALTYAPQPGFNPDSQQGRPKAPYRSTSMMGSMMKGRVSRLYPEPIAEENDHGEQQSDSVSTLFPSENTWAMPHMSNPSPVPHELSTSTSVPNLNTRSSVPPQPPATLIGMREMLLRTKVSGPFVSQPGSDRSSSPNGNAMVSPASRRGSLEAISPDSYLRNTTPAFNDRSSSHSIDLDDLPLSQRRAIIRQSSSMSFSSAAKLNRTSYSSLTGAATSHSPSPVPVATAESTPFNSHQPQRHSTVAPEKVRQAQLANFRNSVQADLKSKASSSALVRKMSIGGETNFLTGGILGVSSSMSSLHNAFESGDWVARRATLLSQREAEVMKQEAERLEKEKLQREFEERMRSGQMMEAHRDALRRIQRGAKNV
ncbi:hypothetical protein QBC38DRAFT_493869 [Podospora fimiseda]|uniref:TM7S3/TM198-like domain-containing protein n=1 Tax=Podospora fimiseda TaxID=252190 RepID=A0AAN7BE49_9PEZI|nr:hypothetical protein QBC38DRAFT_493869 [Podospora fimiseda]